MLRLCLFLLVAVISTVNAVAQNDSVAAQPADMVHRVINYFTQSNKKPIGRNVDFSIIGGPHYSSDAKFGIGVVAAGVYSTQPDNSATSPSNISIYGDATTAAHFKVGVRGAHFRPNDRQRITYDLALSHIDTKFWGIGYDHCFDDVNETKYKYVEASLDAVFAWRLGRNFYVGPMVTMSYVKASHFERQELWRGLPHSTFSYGFGASLSFDTRDNVTAPSHGVLVRIDQTFNAGWIGNRHGFSANDFGASWYGPLWRGCTIATRLHSRFTWGDTPWTMLSIVGNSYDMRGYFEGRFRDKSEIDACVELRQHVLGRSGVVAWFGAASMFPQLSEIRLKEVMPNYGFGYRWEFKRNMNVRIDFGFGRHQSGFVFNINEAF